MAFARDQYKAVAGDRRELSDAAKHGTGYKHGADDRHVTRDRHLLRIDMGMGLDI